MKEIITRKLEEAYVQLGVHDREERESLCRQAMTYFVLDRERYIELADSDTPEYRISCTLGAICRMIPLALRLKKETKENSIRHESQILYLVITEDNAEYALETSARYTDANGKQERLRFPVHRRKKLADFEDGFAVMPPEHIVPVASGRQRRIFQMIFLAIAKFSTNLHINAIPQKTERAVFSIPFAPKQTITLAGEQVTGTWIPLAIQGSLFDEFREDHCYSQRRELALMIAGGDPFYVMKTVHIYQYFRKVVYDDAPGACRYEPTEKKQETTYEKVALDEIRGEFYPSQYY